MQAIATRTPKTEIDIDAVFARWRRPGGWKLFAREMLRVDLDPEQEAILDSVQVNKMNSVISGTGRGKDYTAAVVALCFLYLTPKWNSQGVMIENTKVILTAPTDRQIGNVMIPEITRIWQGAKHLPGRLVGYDIRTDTKEWYLTGFAADPTKPEAWAGLHAVHILFIATEATGISDIVYAAIEGNLQGDSRLLLIANPNTTVGYLADSQRSDRFHKFRLNSLNAPNVLAKKIIIPGQVDYDWVLDKVINWTVPIAEEDMRIEQNDFVFEGQPRRPNDEFRKKVLGVFPKVSEGVLVPPEWIDAAFENWKKMQSGNIITRYGDQGTPAALAKLTHSLRLGTDVAGMGRDSSVFCHRFGNYVEKFTSMHSGGKAEHMQVVGIVVNIMKENNNAMRGLLSQCFIDTIGEGAGAYSRLLELGEGKESLDNNWLKGRVHSVKFSEAAEWDTLPLQDMTKQYTFLNMRAWLYWAVRDWLDPQNNNQPALPPNARLKEELTQTLWQFMSNGKIKIEPKEEIKKRLKRSPDDADALANTFYPVRDIEARPAFKKTAAKFFPG